MLDTIYHQEQKIKSQSFFLEFHNAYTSRIENDINDLKDIITNIVTPSICSTEILNFPKRFLKFL